MKYCISRQDSISLEEEVINKQGEIDEYTYVSSTTGQEKISDLRLKARKKGLE